MYSGGVLYADDKVPDAFRRCPNLDEGLFNGSSLM
jgi:hypothetical protein